MDQKMEEISTFIKRVKMIGAISFVIFLLPIILFCIKFCSYKLSENPADWGDFGDYIGGVVGTNLSIIAIIISFSSIYYSMKMSMALQDNEIKFNNKMADKEKKIIENQSKPYLYFELNRIPEKTEIEICNFGNGPMIIKKIEIEYNETEIYSNFHRLFSEKFGQIEFREILVKYNTAPNHILPPNGKKNLLELMPFNEMNKIYLSEIHEIREILSKSKIKIQFEDIFENKFDHSQGLTFLRNYG